MQLIPHKSETLCTCCAVVIKRPTAQTVRYASDLVMHNTIKFTGNGMHFFLTRVQHHQLYMQQGAALCSHVQHH